MLTLTPRMDPASRTPSRRDPPADARAEAPPTRPPELRDLDPPAKPIRMVAIDIDGTLMRSDKQVTRRSARAIAEASRRGVSIVLASARPPRSVRELHRELGLTTPSVHYNGALVFDAATRTHLFHRPLARRTARRAVRLARRIDRSVVVSIERLDRWLTDRVDPTLLVETARNSEPDFLGSMRDCLREDVTKLMLLAPPDRLAPVRDRLHAKLGGELAVHVSDRHVLQLVHREVDKAAAVRWIADRRGIAADEVMAIGDAPNDAGMLRWAGLGVAMENAWPQALAAADAVAPSNDAEGVTAALERFVLE